MKMKHKNPGGRPKKWSDKEIELIRAKLNEYINKTQIPIIAEFAYKNNLLRESLYDNEEFSTLLKKCIYKKQVMLEKGTLIGQLNPAMAIFSLKQIGWRDKQEIDHTIQGLGTLFQKDPNEKENNESEKPDKK